MTPTIAVMAPMITAGFGMLFLLAYVAFIIGVTVIVLWLLGRFVSAHERMASSLDMIARKLKDDGKP